MLKFLLLLISCISFCQPIDDFSTKFRSEYLNYKFHNLNYPIETKVIYFQNEKIYFYKNRIDRSEKNFSDEKELNQMNGFNLKESYCFKLITNEEALRSSFRREYLINSRDIKNLICFYINDHGKFHIELDFEKDLYSKVFQVKVKLTDTENNSTLGRFKLDLGDSSYLGLDSGSDGLTHDLFSKDDYNFSWNQVTSILSGEIFPTIKTFMNEYSDYYFGVRFNRVLK